MYCSNCGGSNIKHKSNDTYRSSGEDKIRVTETTYWCGDCGAHHSVEKSETVIKFPKDPKSDKWW